MKKNKTKFALRQQNYQLATNKQTNKTPTTKIIRTKICS